MIIRPEISVTPDCPTVKFREASETINLDIEIPKLLVTQGWLLGTVFIVQFINSERTKLIKAARFMVVAEDDSLNVANPEGYQPMTKTIYTREAKQMEAWFWPGGEPSAAEKVVKWNAGKKKFEVLQDTKVVFSDADKVKAEAFRDAA